MGTHVFFSNRPRLIPLRMHRYSFFAPKILSGLKMAAHFAEVRFTSVVATRLTMESRRRTERAASLPH
jgi:hypothetical protein